jgi:nucleotide-binding universal stress UspA family protein
VSEQQQSTVLVVSGSADPAPAAAQWARRFVHERGARYLEAPPRAPLSTVLDLAYKEDAQFLISGLRCGADSPTGQIDDQLAALMRRAPCPVWTVQPWAGQATVSFKRAVVGVDPSTEARAAAHAAAAMLRRSESVPRLILVHGLADHPSQMAATRRWPDILASMQIERHPWIEDLVRELADPRLIVDAITQPVWAPDLIGGVARCQAADFIALGSGWRSESATIRASSVIRHVVRATPCPVLTVDAA